jgi:hypothetical protein
MLVGPVVQGLNTGPPERRMPEPMVTSGMWQEIPQITFWVDPKMEDIIR